MKLHRKGGFTLLELLVVIAVIGLLATIILVTVNNARLKSRNAKRISEARQAVLAFNLYFNENGSFPGTTGTYYCISKSCYGNWTQYDTNRIDSAIIPKYLSGLLDDPIGGRRINGRSTGGFLFYKNAMTNIPGEQGSIGPGHSIVNYLLEAPGKCEAGFQMSHVSGEYVECVATLN